MGGHPASSLHFLCSTLSPLPPLFSVHLATHSHPSCHRLCLSACSTSPASHDPYPHLWSILSHPLLRFWLATHVFCLLRLSLSLCRCPVASRHHYHCSLLYIAHACFLCMRLPYVCVSVPACLASVHVQGRVVAICRMSVYRVLC